MTAVMIGIDPHKGSHTAVAINVGEAPLGRVRVPACPGQAGQLLAWAQAWPERTWAAGGATGLGHLLAQQLVAAGEQVLDIQPKLAARIRVLETGNTSKNDPNDARPVAVAALRSRARREVTAADQAAVLRMRSRRHQDLGQSRPPGTGARSAPRRSPRRSPGAAPQTCCCAGGRLGRRSVLMGRRSSMALYPSAACFRGNSRSKTLPGLMVRFQMRPINSGRNRRVQGGRNDTPAGHHYGHLLGHPARPRRRHHRPARRDDAEGRGRPRHWRRPGHVRPRRRGPRLQHRRTRPAALAGLAIAIAGALGPAIWAPASRTTTTTALRTE